MLLKGAVGSVHTRGNVAGTCCNEVSSCAIPVYAKNIFVLATHSAGLISCVMKQGHDDLNSQTAPATHTNDIEK